MRVELQNIQFPVLDGVGPAAIDAMPTQRIGCFKGRGFEDFPNVSLDGSKHDATPASDARFESADAKYLLPTDFNGKPRNQTISGAIAR